jgi:hypothetical protein
MPPFCEFLLVLKVLYEASRGRHEVVDLHLAVALDRGQMIQVFHGVASFAETGALGTMATQFVILESLGQLDNFLGPPSARVKTVRDALVWVIGPRGVDQRKELGGGKPLLWRLIMGETLPCK